MFYATKIVSVGNGYVVDAHGKTLSFIGHLPVKVGDSVITDGTFVFGNSKPRGSNILTDEPSGIPVLSAYLRGYYTQNGSYKTFNVAGEHWIVNDKKNYAHDNGEEENIIDAEIADDGELLTVTKNCEILDDFDDDYFYRYHHDHMASTNREWLAYSMIDYDLPHSGWFQKSSYSFPISANNADYVKHDDTVIKKCDLVISKNHTVINTLNFDNVINYAENTANDLIPAEIASEFLHSCRKSRAYLVNFKILPSGHYIYLIRVATWVEHYKLVTDNNLQYTNGSTPVLNNYLFKVSSNTGIEILAQSVRRFPFLFDKTWADVDVPDGIIDGSEEAHNIISPYSIAKPNYPYTVINTVTKLGYLGGGIGASVYYLVWFSSHKVWDSEMAPNANDYKNVAYDISDNFLFPIQDGYQAKFKKVNDKNIDNWQLETILDNNNQIISSYFPNTNAHKWNMAIVPLTNGYLFGVHNNFFYFIDDNGHFNFIDYEPKNFRLRELKKIRKAKK